MKNTIFTKIFGRKNDVTKEELLDLVDKLNRAMTRLQYAVNDCQKELNSIYDLFSESN